jgi:hypothetical protein
MRRCSSCRSLLLGDLDSCPRCNAPLRVAVGVAPAAAPAPAAFAAPTVAAPTPAWPPAPAAPSAPSAPAPYGRLSIPTPGAFTPAQQYVVETPAKTATLRKPWARVALAVAVVLVVGAAIMHLRSDPLPAGTTAFVSGDGVTYTSPDGAFQVQLPQQPEVQHHMLTINGVNAPLYLGIVQTHSYAIGVASLVSPVPFNRSRINDALDAMASQGVKSAHGTGVHKVMTMHGAQPAIDARFKVNGHVGHMLAVATDSSIILLFVFAKSGTDRLYKALDDSLLIR